MLKVSVRGRPTDLSKQEEQKDKLLNAAQGLLTEKSYRDISIREIASHAGVNSAMVSYYFDSKEGLFLGLLDQMSKNHFSSMQKIANDKNPIKAFIYFMLKMLSQNSGFARFIYDEFGKNQSQLGDIFMERFPKRMAKILPALIMKHSAIKDKDSAKFAAFSLMSMIVMPFVGKSVREQAWDIEHSTIQSPEWAEHIYTLFIGGCGLAQKIKEPISQTDD